MAVGATLVGQEAGSGQIASVVDRGRPPVHDVTLGVHPRVAQNRIHLVESPLAEQLEPDPTAFQGLTGGQRRADVDPYFKMLTARAMTSPRMASEPAACTAIVSLAQRASGMTSVGLKAVALVNPRYR